MMNVVSGNREKAFHLYTLFRYNYKGLNKTNDRVEKSKDRSMKSVQTGVTFICRCELEMPAATGLLHLAKFGPRVNQAF